MAKKKKKGGFAYMDFLIVGGIASAAYFLFSSFSRGPIRTDSPALTPPANPPNPNTTTAAANTGAGAGADPTKTCNGVPILYNGFPNSGFNLPTSGDSMYTYTLSAAEKDAKLVLGAKGMNVVAFQIYLNHNQKKANLIAVDGVLGPQTVASLNRQVTNGVLGESFRTYFNNGSLTLRSVGKSTIEGVQVAKNCFNFKEGFIPICPKLTSFCFGSISWESGVYYDGFGSDLDNDIIN